MHTNKTQHYISEGTRDMGGKSDARRGGSDATIVQWKQTAPHIHKDISNKNMNAYKMTPFPPYETKIAIYLKAWGFLELGEIQHRYSWP